MCLDQKPLNFITYFYNGKEGQIKKKVCVCGTCTCVIKSLSDRFLYKDVTLLDKVEIFHFSNEEEIWIIFVSSIVHMYETNRLLALFI